MIKIEFKDNPMGDVKQTLECENILFFPTLIAYTEMNSEHTHGSSIEILEDKTYQPYQDGKSYRIMFITGKDK